RISPPSTAWPPKRFTPSRWAFESRPLRELPTPFLCAIIPLRKSEARIQNSEWRVSASALPLFRFRTADFRLLTPDFLIFRFALRADGFNAHGGEVLAVAVRLLVLLAALLLKDD